MTSTLLYPYLAGSDIGCGITVFPITLRRAVPERLAARFPDRDQALDPDRDADHPAWQAVPGATPDGVPAGYLVGLGTVGAATTFAELARIGPLLDPQAASTTGEDGSARGGFGEGGSTGLAEGSLVLLMHSGSRGLGERILRTHTDWHGACPAPDPAAYLTAHDEAVR